MTEELKNEHEGPLAKELNLVEEKFREENGAESAALLTNFIGGMDAEGIKSHALKMGEKAPDFTLINATGRKVTLSEAIRKGPVILTWYRGGWCPYCNLALAYLQRFLPEFIEAGAELIAITPEKPDASLTTKEKHDLEFEVLTDEQNRVAKLYGGVNHLNKEIKEFYQKEGVLGYYEDDIQEF